MIAAWLLILASVGVVDPCRPADPQGVAARYPSFDAYLAARAKAGHTDAPHYRRLPDGRYACVVFPRPSTPPAVFTREDLAQAYGFATRRKRRP